MQKGNAKIVFNLFGLFVAIGFQGCGQRVQDLPSSVDGDERESAQQEPSTADRCCAELDAQTSSLSDRFPSIDPVVAEHALKLVDARCWKEAAALLEKLNDTDFIVPLRNETVDVDDNGIRIVEVIPEHYIGNRSAALVRCYYHLGRLQDTLPYVWQVIDDGRFEPTCLRSIINLNRDDLNPVVKRAKTIASDDPHNTAAEKLLEYVELVRHLDNKSFDLAIGTITLGCSCPGGTTLGPKDAYDRLAAETIAQRGNVVVPHLVAKLQSSSDEVQLCIVFALELCPDERGLRALIAARKGVRNDRIGKRVDQAIEEVRARLARTSD